MSHEPLRALTPGCIPGLAEVVQINDTIINSDLTIIQGTGTAGAGGGYVVAIGFDYLDVLGAGLGESSSPVTVGGDTSIVQNYFNNLIFLGDPGNGNPGSASSFTTAYLDVNVGLGGSAVVAANTTVLYGSLFAAYTLEANGGTNTYFEYGTNSGVTADPAFFNYFFI